MKNWVIKLENVTISYKLDAKIAKKVGSGRIFTPLSNINLSLLPGEFLSISGPNGSGKTSLLKVMSGLILILILIPQCSGNSEIKENPDKLFEQINTTVDEALKLEETSYSDAFNKYRQAVELLDTLTTSHPSSKITVKLRKGDVLLNDMTMNDFKQHVFHVIKKKARLESDPGVCAFNIIKIIF